MTMELKKDHYLGCLGIIYGALYTSTTPFTPPHHRYHHHHTTPHHTTPHHGLLAYSSNMPRYDLAMRSAIVTMRAIGMTTSEISERTNISIRTISSIWKRALERGFDPQSQPSIITEAHVTDAVRSGRPEKQTQEVIHLALSKARPDRYGREKTFATIASELCSALNISISSTTVWRASRRAGFRKTRPTRKAGLNAKMRLDRLRWCLQRQYWDSENVTWTDETSKIQRIYLFKRKL
ncbi:uncharacterized protein N7484_000548 [Penicillium longicatenatum]|uniref:uncharacterized protein n=1 Tax=Penicillium longicatenatum TaxID=1561947 RepID=UPI002546F549|nr:uncharacterized protein N7484_000548 [Penicillium longicatenatum]KAJ5661176.1 hypothetical protein N7484_000548 [Penicillium longicatenatum]